MVGNYIVFLTFSRLIDPFSLSSSCHKGKNRPLSRSIFQLSGVRHKTLALNTISTIYQCR
jgi:hypothetical protein